MFDILSVLALALVLLPAALLLADFGTGIVHWLEDNFGAADWPVIGKYIIAPNRLHHDDPLAFTRAEGFWYRNNTTIIAVAIIGAVMWLVLPPLGTALNILLAEMLLFGALSNQIHYWAHVPDRAPRIVSWLQSVGALQSRSHHGGHHLPPHQRRYCILTNWLNPLLDRIRFWSLIEKPIPQRWFAKGTRP